MPHIVFVGTKVNRRPQLEPGAILVREQLVGHVKRVLSMHEHQSFVDYETLRFERPDRHSASEPELAHVMLISTRLDVATALFATDDQLAPVRQAKNFREMIEHDHPPER